MHVCSGRRCSVICTLRLGLDIVDTEEHHRARGQVDGLLLDPIQRMAMSRGALKSVDEMRGALERTQVALEPFLHPLRLSLSLERGGRPGQGRAGNER